MEAFKNQSCLGITVVGSLFANEPANVLQAESQVSLSCTMFPQEVRKLFSKFIGVGSHSSSESRTTKAKLSVIRRNSMILLNIFEWGLRRKRYIESSPSVGVTVWVRDCMLFRSVTTPVYERACMCVYVLLE